jgi:hypothetical protein
MSVHTRSFIETRPKSGGVFSLLIITQVALLAAFASVGLPRVAGLDAGEIVYRVFMACYGLVFPVYVWLFMLPKRGRHPTMLARALIFTILIAMPMYFAGFILNRMVWLIPGVAVALLGRAMVMPRWRAGSRYRHN